MNIQVDTIPYITVFVQGLLSFFSPCVLPLLPVYLAVLSGSAEKENEQASFSRGRTMLHTVFFVLGISFAFLVLGMGMSALGTFFRTKQMLLVRIGGLLILFFGLYQLGLFKRSRVIETERRLPFQMGDRKMSPLWALLLGFVFSFAWTPCVGPTLSSVLLMTATAQTRASGLLLIGIYTLGFVLPFLAVGLFTTSLLALFKKHQSVVKYTVKIGGVILIAMGLMMLTGKMNSITGYLSAVSGGQTVSSAGAATTAESSSAAESASATSASTEEGASAEESATAAESAEGKETETNEQEESDVYPAPAFELYDQFGEKHTLEDYRGKVIFLNFWATWCPPCRSEMPDIQKLYEKYGGTASGEDASEGADKESEVVVLGVAFPNYGREGSEEEITQFLNGNGYSYPVLLDTKAELAYAYGITAYPTTFMIDREGNLYGYVTGAIDYDLMESIVEQTLNG